MKLSSHNYGIATLSFFLENFKKKGLCWKHCKYNDFIGFFFPWFIWNESEQGANKSPGDRFTAHVICLSCAPILSLIMTPETKTPIP